MWKSLKLPNEKGEKVNVSKEFIQIKLWVMERYSRGFPATHRPCLIQILHTMLIAAYAQYGGFAGAAIFIKHGAIAL